MEVCRILSPGLGKQLETFEVTSHSWVNHDFSFGGEYLEAAWLMYNWDTQTALDSWGKSDGYMHGEWRYSVYQFEARINDKKQRFVVYAYPKKSGKGASMELFEPIHVEFIRPILQWLHDTHPRANEPPPWKVSQKSESSDGEA